MLDESMALDWLFEWPARAIWPSGRGSWSRPARRPLQARVLLALGRSLHRFNQDQEAVELLREAAALAEAIGDAGYEVQVTADLLLGFVLPFLGRLDEAEERLREVEPPVRGEGRRAAPGRDVEQPVLPLDRAQRSGALHGGQRARARLAARRMGNANVERIANLNSAYFLYWRGELEAAEPFARRMIEIDERYFRQGGFRPDGAGAAGPHPLGPGRTEARRQLVEEVRAPPGGRARRRAERPAAAAQRRDAARHDRPR